MSVKDQANSLSYVMVTREPTATNFSVSASGLTDIYDFKGVLYGTKWTGNTIYYSFPVTVADFGPSYEAPEGLINIRPVTIAQKNVILYGLNEVSEITSLKFIPVEPSSPNSPQLRFVNSDYPVSAYSYYPDPSDAGGDAFYGPYIDASPAKGSYSWHVIIHELGHQLGLKHGHEEFSVYGETGQALTQLRDSQDYSIMTYRSSLGAADLYYRIADGEAPTSFMMSDMLALQYLYGANFSTREGNTTYRWTPSNNNTVIIENGVTTIKSGGYTGNKLITTIWDGSGEDTYDFGSYTSGLRINLNPGNFSITSPSQLADLNDSIVGNEALGNVYNAYLFNGDRQSLIENAIAGSGDDHITGNMANNKLYGNFGNDIIYGLEGNDLLEGRAGDDVLIGGMGFDTMNGGEGSDIYFIESLDHYSSLEVIADTGVTGVDELRFAVQNPGTLRLRSAIGGIENVIIGTGLSNTPVTSGTIAGNINASAVGYGLKITGNDGDNIITGTSFNDVIIGGAGRDTLIGGRGLDFMTGGHGADLFQVSGISNITDFGLGADVIQVANGGIANINIHEAWRATSSSFNNGVVNISTNGFNVDLASLTAGRNGFNITSTGAPVVLTGSRFNDVISGGPGNDLITGGVGKDVIDGHGGFNIFIYRSIADSQVGLNSDLIVGFDRGRDKIDLSLIDARQQAGFAGDQAFLFSAKASPNSVWWQKNDADAIIYGDVNGVTNGTVVADFAIKLQGVSASLLSANDFIA